MFYITVFAFWKTREKQMIDFIQQIDPQIGKFLSITKSSSFDVYKQLIDIGINGKYYYYQHRILRIFVIIIMKILYFPPINDPTVL